MSYKGGLWRTLSAWPRGTALSPAELALAFGPLFARTPTSNPCPLALVTWLNLLPALCGDYGIADYWCGWVGGGPVPGAVGKILGKQSSDLVLCVLEEMVMSTDMRPLGRSECTSVVGAGRKLHQTLSSWKSFPSAAPLVTKHCSVCRQTHHLLYQVGPLSRQTASHDATCTHIVTDRPVLTLLCRWKPRHKQADQPLAPGTKKPEPFLSHRAVVPSIGKPGLAATVQVMREAAGWTRTKTHRKCHNETSLCILTKN